MEDYCKHDINTGHIYQDLYHNYKKYGIDFFEKTEKTYQEVLLRHRVIQVEWSKDRDEYMKGYFLYSNPDNIKRTSEKPHKDFFLHPTEAKGRGEGEYPYDLYSFSKPFVLNKDEDEFDFDFFFALKLSLTDVMGIKEFLAYQLQRNFTNNNAEYREFLEALLIKHEDMLKNSKAPVIVNKYLMENPIKEQPQSPENTNPIQWQGTAGQLVYLFELLRKENYVPVAMDLQAMIKKHFVDSKGKTFTALRQSKQNYLNSKTAKPKQADTLEDIVNRAKKK